MLNCLSCGHDNFPVTNARIYGWADGPSLQVVEFCTECGDRITEKCRVCQRLHPPKANHCSVYGINIQEFLDLKTDVQARVEVFKNLPEAKEAMAEIARHAYKFRRIFLAGCLVFVVGLCSAPSMPLLGLGGLITGVALVVGSLWWMFGKDSRISNNMMVLWKNTNPGVLEPSSIGVHSKSIKIRMDSGGDDLYNNRVSFEDRILRFMLNPVQQLS